MNKYRIHYSLVLDVDGTMVVEAESLESASEIAYGLTAKDLYIEGKNKIDHYESLGFDIVEEKQ